MYRIYFDCGREKAITRTHVLAGRLAPRTVGVEFLGRHARCNGSRQAAIPDVQLSVRLPAHHCHSGGSTHGYNAA